MTIVQCNKTSRSDQKSRTSDE